MIGSDLRVWKLHKSLYPLFCETNCWVSVMIYRHLHTLEFKRPRIGYVAIFSDVRDYIQNCSTYQRVDKSGHHFRAPLINLPVINKIFSRIAIDIVGPFQRCVKSENRFLLTVICMASHFPLAYPLKCNTAEEVVKCLIEVFTVFGFPDKLLSDCGSEFMSDLMQAFLCQIQVWHIHCSPYHPQSNGSLKRLHRTLKNMMKSVLETYAGDWDETVPWLLFAYREVPVESLLFSPFELLFGRNARGVLQLTKQNWLNDDVVQNLKSTNVIDFVLNLREKIKISLVTANEIESNAKKKSKIYYDRKSQPDSLNVGDQVLLLLPLRGKPLHARYSGPYTVEARIGEVDYVVLNL